MRSLYIWQGERGEAAEVGVLFKTDASALDRATARLAEIHPTTTRRCSAGAPTPRQADRRVAVGLGQGARAGMTRDRQARAAAVRRARDGALPVLAAGPAGRRTGRFDPPSTPMLYTRRLERGSGRRDRLIVSRSFAVRFVPERGGLPRRRRAARRRGRGPAQLAAFARLERERVETGRVPARARRRGRDPRAAASGRDSARSTRPSARPTREIERWQLPRPSATRCARSSTRVHSQRRRARHRAAARPVRAGRLPARGARADLALPGGATRAGPRAVHRRRAIRRPG
jgi:hypothetical protein